MSLPSVGKKAPDFTLLSETGEPLTLSSLRGKPVVLYFYPQDDTETCTKEACDFRDLFPRFSEEGVVILGVSPDSVKSHVKFKSKYALPFTLLADTEKQVIEKYGLWQEKLLYGRTYMGVVRTTFVIDAKGTIRRIFENVRTRGHAEAVKVAIDAIRPKVRTEPRAEQ